MRTWLTAVLLASTGVAPALAQPAPPPDRGPAAAQPDQRPGGDRGTQGRPGGDRRGPGGGGPGGGPDRPDPNYHHNPAYGGPGGPRPGGWGQGRPGGEPGRPGDGGGRPGWNGDRPGGPGGHDGRPGGPDGDGGRPDRPRGDGGRPGWQDGGRPDRPGWNGGDRPDRPGWNGGGRPDRPGWDHPGGHPPGWQDGRPGWQGGGRGGNWNRGWRDDRRYDWQGWRNQHRGWFRRPRYQPPYGFGYGYRGFAIGAAIPSAYFAQNYWIGDPGYYRLPPAYGPYRWVRYYGDALLIDIYSGRVVDVIRGIFW